MVLRVAFATCLLAQSLPISNAFDTGHFRFLPAKQVEHPTDTVATRDVTAVKTQAVRVQSVSGDEEESSFLWPLARFILSLLAAMCVATTSSRPALASSRFVSVPTKEASPLLSKRQEANAPLYCSSGCPDGSKLCECEGQAAAAAVEPAPAWGLLAGIISFGGGIYFLRQYLEKEKTRCDCCSELVTPYLIGPWEIKPGTDVKARRYSCQACGHSSEWSRRAKKIDRALLQEQQPLAEYGMLATLSDKEGSQLEETRKRNAAKWAKLSNASDDATDKTETNGNTDDERSSVSESTSRVADAKVAGDSDTVGKSAQG